MNCFVHDRVPAVGICSICQKAVCRDCVGLDTPRVVCGVCARQRNVFGYEYRSSASLGGLPLMHICLAVDPVTGRPRVAKGIIAIGNIAIGGVAIAGVSCGLITIGGISCGALAALGGLALGLGFSVGGLAIGSVALGGVAVGFTYAFGGAAFGPAIVDGRRCDLAALEFFRHWIGSSVLPPACR